MQLPEHKEAWTSEKIFNDGNSYFRSLEIDIAQAKKNIYFEVYIFEDDHLGKLVLKWLEQAHKRGVDVWLLVDGIGTANWNYKKILAIRALGIKAKIYHPLPWQMQTWKYLNKLFYYINRRNHRKTCTIDEKIAYVGGINVTAKSVGWLSGEKAWRDTAIRVEGKDVKDLVSAFNEAWQQRFALPKKTHYKKYLNNSLIRLNNTRANRTALHRNFKFRIRKAQKRIWMTTPYFVPSFSFVRALTFAAKKGVDVRILVPQHPDVKIMKWFHLAYFNFLARTSVQIYTYIPTMLHAKTYLIDDFGVVGSSNLNHRSVLHDLEANVIVTHKESIHILENQFLTDLKHSKHITRNTIKISNFFQKLYIRFLIRMRHWF
jgi:cardiolipin synthase